MERCPKGSRKAAYALRERGRIRKRAEILRKLNEVSALWPDDWATAPMAKRSKSMSKAKCDW